MSSFPCRTLNLFSRAKLTPASKAQTCRSSLTALGLIQSPPAVTGAVGGARLAAQAWGEPAPSRVWQTPHSQSPRHKASHPCHKMSLVIVMLWVLLISVCISNPASNFIEFLVSNSYFLGKNHHSLISHQVKWLFPASSLHLSDEPPAPLLGNRENQVFPSSLCHLLFCKSPLCLHSLTVMVPVPQAPHFSRWPPSTLPRSPCMVLDPALLATRCPTDLGCIEASLATAAPRAGSVGQAVPGAAPATSGEDAETLPGLLK